MVRRIFLFPVIMALALMTLASLSNANSKPAIKATFDVTSTTKLGPTTLVPGHYSVVVDGNQAKFERDGKSVIEVPRTLKDLSAKAQQTQVQTDDHDQLNEIKVAGKTQAIEFSGNNASGN